MSAVPFDTLKFASRLQSGGFTAEQAGAAAEAFADATSEELATRGDINVVRADLTKVESSLKSDIRELELRMTIKLGGLIIAATGVILAGLRYLPAGHP